MCMSARFHLGIWRSRVCCKRLMRSEFWRLQQGSAHGACAGVACVRHGSGGLPILADLTHLRRTLGNLEAKHGILR